MSLLRRPKLLLARVRTRLAPPVALPLAAVFLLFSVAGCLSTNVNVRSSGEQGGGVLVRVFADADAAKAGRTETSGTLVELYRVDKGGETFLQRSLAGQWGVSQLPPGKYRVRVVAVLDSGGNIRETRSGDRETDFKVNDGQTAEIKIILKKTPTGLIVVAAVTVVVIMVALAVILSKNDIHPPSPGRVFAHLPPPPPLPPVIIAPEIWVAPAEAPLHRERIPGPQVTSVFPEPGSEDVPRRVLPTISLSQPIDETRLGAGAVLMLGSRSGLVPGSVSVHRGLLRFEPGRELAPGETVTVTVKASGVANPDGKHLTEDFSWSFEIAE